MSTPTTAPSSKLIVALKKLALTSGFMLPIFGAAAFWHILGSADANKFNASFWLGNFVLLAFLIAIFGSIWGGHESTGNRKGPIIVIIGWIGVFVGYIAIAALVASITGQFLVGSYGWGVLASLIFIGAIGLGYLSSHLFSKID